jgi:hypothetical protein
MITCSSIGYNGRLANQMFQFASTVGIARKLGYDAKFPEENFIQGNPHDYNGGKLRECFNIPDRYFSPANFLSSRIQYNYSETEFTFNKETLSLPDNVNIHGYFQNERYFLHCREEILNCFTFKDNIISRGSNVERDSVSVHVRRGDYTQYPDHHPTQSPEYYKKALEISDKKNIYVFSDDLVWCKNNISAPNKNMIFLEEPDPFVSLLMMSLCEDNIISNSSYGWWAAWLNKNQDKKVIGPTLWFGPSMRKDTSDILPPSWIKI